MSGLRFSIVVGLSITTCVIVFLRGWSALAALTNGDESAFLAFPLTVILPALAFAFLTMLRHIKSAEGALMQLGAMIQVMLIIAWPGFALYLALGFPVVFLVVEMFETHLTPKLRDPIKRVVLV